MSPCQSCGAAVKPKDVDEPEKSGHFSEEWECSNGHVGYVRGKEEQPPNKWTRYGSVFEE